MTGSIAAHSWLGASLLLGAGGILFIPSLAAGKLRLQHQAALHLAGKPMVFWSVCAFIAAGRLALLWVVLGGKPTVG